MSSNPDLEGTCWDAPSFLDISLDIIRSVPSKKVNEHIIPPKELHQFRKTWEEGNVCVSPLEILRAFGALSMIAEGETLDVLVRCLRRCAFGYADGKQTAEQIHNYLHQLSREYVDGFTQAAVRIFFEKHSVLQFDPEITKTMNAYYLEPTIPEAPELKEGESVLKEANFNISPHGEVTRLRINKAMKIATNGRVEHVIRRDLAPGWRARQILASCMNGNFHWKTTCSEKSRNSYFYDSPDHRVEKRSVLKAVKAECMVRTIVWKGRMRILELESYDANVKLYIVQPLNTDLTRVELASMDGDQLREYIDECSKQPQKEVSVMIPVIAMSMPIALRSAFNHTKGSLLCQLVPKHAKNSIPSIGRVFCPFKSDFNRAIDTNKGYGLGFIYPLFDHYHKTKFNIVLSKRNPINLDELRDLINPPLDKYVTAAQPPFNPHAPPEAAQDQHVKTERKEVPGRRTRIPHPSEKRRVAVSDIEQELEFTPIRKKAKPSQPVLQVSLKMSPDPGDKSDCDVKSTDRSRIGPLTSKMSKLKISKTEVTGAVQPTQTAVSRTQMTTGEKTPTKTREKAGADTNNNNSNNSTPHHSQESGSPVPLLPSSRASASERMMNGSTYVKYRDMRKARRASSNPFAREDRSKTLKFDPDEEYLDASRLNTEASYAPMDAQINIDSSFLFVGVATNSKNHRFPLYMGRFTNITETFTGGADHQADPMNAATDHPVV